jgi:hypothetical protein
MIPLQLDFFMSPHECELIALRKELSKCRTTLDKVRKGTYCELSKLKQECEDLKYRQDIIERHICNESKV